MRYGVHVHNFGDWSDPRALADLARETEQAGWDGFFVCDHLQARTEAGPQPIAEPWIAMAAAAMATSRVLIGPMVAALPRRRPSTLAAEAVTLDRLSGGRLVLGVGLGTVDRLNFAPWGEELDLRTRGRMLDEMLEVLQALWRGERVDHDGERYHLKDALLLPKPVNGRIPLWVAGHWPHKRPFRRAARFDGVFIDVEGIDWMRGEMMSPQTLKDVVDFTLGERRSGEAFEVVIGGHGPDDPAELGRRLEPYVAAGLTWWVEGIHQAWGSREQLLVRVRRGPPRTGA